MKCRCQIAVRASPWRSLITSAAKWESAAVKSEHEQKKKRQDQRKEVVADMRTTTEFSEALCCEIRKKEGDERIQDLNLMSLISTKPCQPLGKVAMSKCLILLNKRKAINSTWSSNRICIVTRMCYHEKVLPILPLPRYIPNNQVFIWQI